MTWNYRVVRRKALDEEIYEIHEVHYDESKNITAYTERSIAPMGYSQNGLKKDLMKMMSALSKPVLDLEELDKNITKS